MWNLILLSDIRGHSNNTYTYLLRLQWCLLLSSWQGAIFFALLRVFLWFKTRKSVLSLSLFLFSSFLLSLFFSSLLFLFLFLTFSVCLTNVFLSLSLSLKQARTHMHTHARTHSVSHAHYVSWARQKKPRPCPCYRLSLKTLALLFVKKDRFWESSVQFLSFTSLDTLPCSVRCYNIFDKVVVNKWRHTGKSKVSFSPIRRLSTLWLIA